MGFEKLEVKINDEPRYREVLSNSLQEYGDMEIITLDSALQSGNAGVMITFSVHVNGQKKRVQSVTTMKMFRAVANALVTTYTDDGFRVNMEDPLDEGILEDKTDA